MEQKTEASQAVDERMLFEQWAGDSRYKFVALQKMSGDRYVHPGVQADWEVWQACAALKAQPAPTEAQGESEKLAARLAELGITNLKYMPGSDPTVSRERVLQEITRAVKRIQFGESGLFLAPIEAAQGEDSARLDALYYAMCIKPFISAICTKEQWLKSIDDQIDRARASAETGGVK